MPISYTTSQNNELFWEGSHCLKSLVICDSRFESQIAIAVKSRDLEHLVHDCMPEIKLIQAKTATGSQNNFWDTIASCHKDPVACRETGAN